jgi:diacylglycerol kinase (ATP)
MSIEMRSRISLIDSFNYAFQGVIHAVRTQRNMRIHLLTAVAVLIAAIAVGVTQMELIALIIAIAFVLITEMINSAVEGAIDVATTSFDPLAKLAKDMAAGAVLISTITAVAVGFLVFNDHIANPSTHLLNRLENAPVYLTIVALIVTIALVIATKALTHRGTPLRGGLPSGHAAIAFAGWMALTYLITGVEHRFLISALAFLMAMMVAQTRIEAGFHSALEVTYGAVIGALVTLALFQIFA